MSRRRSVEFPENKWLTEKLIKAWQESNKSKFKFFRDLGLTPGKDINITHTLTGDRGFSFAMGMRIAFALGLNLQELKSIIEEKPSC